MIKMPAGDKRCCPISEKAWPGEQKAAIVQAVLEIFVSKFS